jgi:hypothetical protein
MSWTPLKTPSNDGVSVKLDERSGLGTGTDRNQTPLFGGLSFERGGF